MRDSIQGKAWIFGDDVSTDSIFAGHYIGLRGNPTEAAKHLMEDKRPEFAGLVQKDDIIVAGKNFGCGSSREIAPVIIKVAGVGAVLAKSFGRLFYRNAINNGMLIIECDTDSIEEGDQIYIDIKNRLIKKVGDPEFAIPFSLTEKEIKLIDADGLFGYYNQYGTLDNL